MSHKEKTAQYVEAINTQKKRLHTCIMVAVVVFFTGLFTILIVATLSGTIETLQTFFSRYLPIIFGFVLVSGLAIFFMSWRMHRITTRAFLFLSQGALAPTPPDVEPTPGSLPLVPKEACKRDCLKNILAITPTSCYVCDANQDIIDANQACIELFGFRTKADFITSFDKCSPVLQPSRQNSRQFFGEYIAIALEKGQAHLEYTHIIPDTGEKVPTELTFMRLNENGRYVILCYLHDMRKLQKMIHTVEGRGQLLQAINMISGVLMQADTDHFERALFRSLSMMGQVADVERVFVWECTRDKQTHSYKQIYEWSWDEVKFRRMDKAITHTGTEAEDINASLLRGLCVRGNTENLHMETRSCFFLVDVQSFLLMPIFLRGKLWGVMGFCDLKGAYGRSENDENILLSGGLLFANAIIRNDMALRLQQNTQALEAALKNAESASASKSQFLSSMSHEMRTPMNAIMGMSTLGLKAQDIQGKDASFRKIISASSHLFGVINDVLDMSKIEQGELTLAHEPFRLSNVLERVEIVNSPRLEEKRQQLNIKTAPEVPPTMIGDGQRLTQVLTNLVSNAIKFAPEASPIVIAIKRVDMGAGSCILQFDVIDQGIGISTEQQALLFQPFVQAETSTTRNTGGTGLGLAISKRIVELMGGNIWIESQPNRGAIFSFTARLVVTTEGEIKAPKPLLMYQFPNTRLLLVEDVEINRDIIIQVLADSQIEITSALNGAEAVALVEKDPTYFNMILMDIQMPVMDGYEATRAIRQIPHPRAKSVPIIAMTANVFKEDVEACLAAGMDAHLGKPLDFARMFEIFAQYLTRTLEPTREDNA